MVTIAYIEEEVARRIAQLDPSAYRQAAGETWRESPMPLTASRESALKAHMLFSASPGTKSRLAAPESPPRAPRKT